jgi:hypothetical protein
VSCLMPRMGEELTGFKTWGSGPISFSNFLNLTGGDTGIVLLGGHASDSR